MAKELNTWKYYEVSRSIAYALITKCARARRRTPASRVRGQDAKTVHVALA